jgi:hypothetical protein
MTLINQSDITTLLPYASLKDEGTIGSLVEIMRHGHHLSDLRHPKGTT